MDYLRFLGQSESETVRYCTEHSISYRLVETRDPRANANSQTQRRVIRISRCNETMEILVGYFAMAAYDA